MKEIDTESPVLWPAWCYSGNISAANTFNKPPKLVDNVEPIRKALTPQEQKDENLSNINKNSKSIEDIVLHKLPLKRKFNRSSLIEYPVAALETQKKRKRANLTNCVHENMLNEHSLLNSLENLNTGKILEETSQDDRFTSISISPTATDIVDSNQRTTSNVSSNSAAAGLIYLDQFNHEARLVSPNDVIMDSFTGVANNNNNNNSKSVRKKNINKNNSLLFNQMQDLSGNQHQLIFNEGGNAAMKRERLSPSANGEISSTFSRCRSATPSPTQNSLPHQPLHVMPLQTHIPVHNLSTNLLNSLQQAASMGCQSPSAPTTNHPNATNYSDFMRSLAAKYNNSNPNEINTTRRNSYFDNTNLPSSSKKIASSATQKPAISIINPTVVNKDTTQISPLPLPSISSLSPADLAAVALKSQNVQNQMAAAAVAAAGVSPFMTSLLSSLPFSQGMLTPWIDMSNTQALLILSRAAKEAKLEKAMRSMQSPKRSYSSASSSPRPNNNNLNAALQQAAQLISPAMFYSTQSANVPNNNSRQPSPAPKRNTENDSDITSIGERVPGPSLSVPLDLSSQPPEHKRFKAESTSSRSSMEELTNIVTSGLRRASLGITTPSPPLSEKNLSCRPSSNSSLNGTTAKKVNVPPITRHNIKTAPSLNVGRQCQAQSEEVNEWSVEDVCAFVASIDICAEYVQNFRNQQIDGSGLPLLTEDHLVNWLGMKLGPALKLRSILAKKLGGPCPCVACVAQSQQILALHQQQQQQPQPQQQHTDDIVAKAKTLKSTSEKSRESSPPQIQQQQQQFKKEHELLREEQSSCFISNTTNTNNNDNKSDDSPSSNNDNNSHNNNNNNKNKKNSCNSNSICKNTFSNNTNNDDDDEENNNNNNNNKRAGSTESSS